MSLSDCLRICAPVCDTPSATDNQHLMIKILDHLDRLEHFTLFNSFWPIQMSKGGMGTIADVDTPTGSDGRV